ncbi:MAG: hypothetical protein M1819_004006 [Sarea resinae]|nr:MAG: hypothetical protein M1819_004006 [Sarea resinae]
MESSPLTLAHSHARNAQNETHKSNVTAASEEHELAAGEFASAAKTSGDAEALRTLKLLEQHHQKLAEILKFRESQHSYPNPSGEISETSDNAPVASPAPAASSTSSPYKAAVSQRNPSRDLTSSIASNLASARGIPSSQQRRGAPISPTLSAQHAGGKMLGNPTKPRASETRKKQGSPSTNNERVKSSHGAQPSSLPAVAESRESKHSPGVDLASKEEVADQDEEEEEAKASDEPFQRFYSTFEGLLSRLSAPLAFAGLPLTSDEPPTPTPSKPETPQPTTTTTTTTADPDVTSLFSRAALRALREENGSSNAAESFYVVPTTGGTISYAGILSRPEQDYHTHSRNQHSLSSSHTSQDFVDARETPVQHHQHQNQVPPPIFSRRASSNKALSSTSSSTAAVAGRTQDPASTKTLEELHLENRTLKQLTDALSRRLHMWEANAQNSSLALQQSLRSMNHPSSPHHQTSPSPYEAPASTSASPATKTQTQTQPPSQPPIQAQADVDIASRLTSLETQLRETEAARIRTEKENEKLRDVLARYRDRWSKLKEGAKNRREGAGGASTASGNAGLGGGVGRATELKAVEEAEESIAGAGASGGGGGGGDNGV